MIAPTRVDRRRFLHTTAGTAAALTLGRQAMAAEEPSPQKPAAPTAPLAMWALTGSIPPDAVRRQLDAYAAAGWGVVLYPRSGLELEYLGREFLDRIRFIVQQAAGLRMEVWLYDEFNWPSGHAKGQVVEGHDQLRAQLLCVERDGRSNVETVDGSANLLMPEATQRFLAVTHERYAEAIGEFFGSTVRAIFTDEPSLAHQHRPQSTRAGWQFAWSAVLEAQLGEDFRKRLAAAADVAGWSGWRDYWAAYSQTFHDAWVAPIADWCTKHGIAMSGHFLGEGTFGTQVAYNGSLRLQQRAQGLPGIDEISTRSDVAECEALTLASMAELPGRERMVEVFALGPPHMKMGTLCRMVDLCAACGVDRYVMAICPLDLRGGILKRSYLGIHSPIQPCFRHYAGEFAQYVAEAAQRARAAQPLGVPWPSDEELWAAAGPAPRSSKALAAMTAKFVPAAREAIAARLRPEPVRGTWTTSPAVLEATWEFTLLGPNSIRIDRPTLSIVDVPPTAELSVQVQLVRGLRINGKAIDLGAAPPDRAFDISYRRVTITGLLRKGENRLEADLAEEKPLPFLPSLILWGDFAVDPQGRLVKRPRAIKLGDWRTQGYPSFCGTGRYRGALTLEKAPKQVVLDTGGYPVHVVLGGRDLGRRGWLPMRFGCDDAARAGANEIVVEVTSTLGHLFTPNGAPPVGLLALTFEP